MPYHPVNAADSLDQSAIDINNAFDSLATWFQGSTAPSSPVPYQKWFDTTNFILYVRNAGNSQWIPCKFMSTETGIIVTDGTDNITVCAPSTLSEDYTIKLPTAQGGSSTFLRNDGSGNLSWVAGGASGATELDGLSDCTVGSPADGHFLRYNGTRSYFQNQLGVGLSDLTESGSAQGDLVIHDGTDYSRLAIGTSGHVLTVSSGGLPEWSAASGGGSTTLGGLSDVNITAAVGGDYLRHDGSNWVDAAGVDINDLFLTGANTGDIIYYNGAKWAALAAGSPGTVLTAQASGALNWTTVSGGGGSSTLAGLNDVTIGTQSAGQYLRASSATAWANSDLLLSDLTEAGSQEGDIAYHTAGTWTRFPRGTNDQFLRSTGSGIAWETVEVGATNLSGLDDVTISFPITGMVLRYSGSAWVGQFISVGDLNATNVDEGSLIHRGASDWVTLAPPTVDGYVLTWNDTTTSAAWQAPTSGNLDDLLDVVSTGKVHNSYLRWDDPGGGATATWRSELGLNIENLTVTSQNRGDVIVRTSTGWTRLAIGTANQVLSSDGTDITWADQTGGSGSGNAFTTIDTSSGTNPVATTGSDTLTMTGSTGITVTGASTTDTVTFAAVPGQIDHDSLLNFNANEHNDRTSAVTITGGWSFESNSTSETFIDFLNNGTANQSVRTDGDFILRVGSTDHRISTAAGSTPRTYTLPDADGTLTALGNNFVGTGSLVRASDAILTNVHFLGAPTLDSVSQAYTWSAGARTVKLQPDNFSASDTFTFTLPVSSLGTGVTDSAIVTQHTGSFSELVAITDGKSLRMFEASPGTNYGDVVAGSLTGNRTYTLPDVTGTMTVLGNNTTGTGNIVRASSPTITGTLNANSITASSISASSSISIKSPIASRYISMLASSALSADYSITWPASLPSSGTAYMRIDSSGVVTFSSS